MAMWPQFNEIKTTEAAAFLIERHGGKMNYMKLIKLLYLADRNALLTLGRPITFDRYVSMDRGPVLSRTLDLITEGNPPGAVSVWSRHISTPRDYYVEIKEKIEPWELSEAETDILDDIYKAHGHKSKWDLVMELHAILPEWKHPNGSSLPIPYDAILRAGGMDDDEIQMIIGEMKIIGALEVST